MPGSTISMSLRMPRSSAAATLSVRKFLTASTTGPSTFLEWVSPGEPVMCIITAGTADSASRSSIPGQRSALTSFMMSAPADMAALAVSVFMVSADIVTSEDCESLSITGMSLAISSSAGTGVKPGRVDSAPMSMISAPASIILKACSTAASASI